MIRFYAPDIRNKAELPEVESGHCCRVLRMKAGDVVNVVDGRGFAYECVISDAHPKHTQLEIISEKEEPKYWKERIVLAVAPTKNIDRIEWLLEKAVEIGVDEIVLLKCSRSERKNVNCERLEKIIVSAMKQSLKAQMPEFRGMMDFSSFIKDCDTPNKFVGYCDSSLERKSFSAEYKGNSDVAILIGPEGDFTPDEIALALNSGFEAVTFGDTRLRTETAALYAVTAVHVIDSLK